MAKLLTPAQDREIRDAIQLLADTFFDTPVSYKLHKPTMDVFNEDKDLQKFESYELKALYEPMAGATTSSTEKVQGSRDTEEVKLTLNLEDLERSGLINPDHTHKFNIEKDYFECKGRHYKVIDIYYSAPLSKKDVLITIIGRVSKRTTDG